MSRETAGGGGVFCFVSVFTGKEDFFAIDPFLRTLERPQ